MKTLLKGHLFLIGKIVGLHATQSNSFLKGMNIVQTKAPNQRLMHGYIVYDLTHSFYTCQFVNNFELIVCDFYLLETTKTTLEEKLNMSNPAKINI